jgi:hypothetical protein
MWYAAGVVEAAYKRRGHEAVLSCGDDSHEERPASLHHGGLAADWRTRNLPASTLAFIVSDLKELLEPLGFDVVLEHKPPHLHIEYQPKNGEDWQERVE